MVPTIPFTQDACCERAPRNSTNRVTARRSIAKLDRRRGECRMGPSQPIPASPFGAVAVRREPILRAHVGGVEQMIPLGSTLTIGADPRCALCVEEPAVRSLH